MIMPVHEGKSLALYLDPLLSFAVQISKYKLSTCFPMDKTARLDLPLFFIPNVGNIRLITSTSHCNFIFTVVMTLTA